MSHSAGGTSYFHWPLQASQIAASGPPLSQFIWGWRPESHVIRSSDGINHFCIKAANRNTLKQKHFNGYKPEAVTPLDSYENFRDMVLLHRSMVNESHNYHWLCAISSLTLTEWRCSVTPCLNQSNGLQKKERLVKGTAKCDTSVLKYIQYLPLNSKKKILIKQFQIWICDNEHEDEKIGFST